MKNVINLKPVTPTYQALQFKGFESIPEIIEFTGITPLVINGETIQLKKKAHTVKVGEFIIMQGKNIIKISSDLVSYNVLTPFDVEGFDDIETLAPEPRPKETKNAKK